MENLSIQLDNEVIHEKKAINRYLNSVSHTLNSEVDQLVTSFSNLFNLMHNSKHDDMESPQSKFATNSLEKAYVGLLEMSGCNLKMIWMVLDPKPSPLDDQSICDFFDAANEKTAECCTEMTDVLREFERAYSTLHDVIETTKLKEEGASTKPKPADSTEKIHAIPCDYIPRFITDIPLAKKVPHPKECIRYMEAMRVSMQKVVEPWGILLRQVILVSRLLLRFQDYMHLETNIYELRELHDFFGCLQECAKDALHHIRDSKAK